MTDTMNFFEEKELSTTSIADLQHMVKTLSEKRKHYDDEKTKLSALNAEVEELESKILSVLQESNQSKFSVDGIGTVSKVKKYQVSFPKDEENANKLRQFCLEQGYSDKLTVNYQALNSLYNSIKEEKEMRGELDFTDVIPGVGEPVVRETLSLRKGK